MASEKKWKEIGKQQVKFTEEGEQFVGTLTGIEESTLGVKVFSFQPEDKEADEVVILGSVGLDRLMETVVVGEEVCIVYEGQIETKNNRPFRNYRVYRAQ